ncbi:XRE family transcriptional regulator [Siphonobacter sp. BAB-5385]|uniref:helix-turn-helix domain-containing protein n=1 Tax=Siphonobacter sp. BAB-5385 TaxID=1864822 RepID=UPI000B9E2843|nr:XRE family transcriptional regulator [Siphonobacter sp. BAB-5385]OZI05353.1 XRE family transcriptional regulator [Siphonobacter sp. BAB-5385]
MSNRLWFILDKEEAYEAAMARYQELKYAEPESIAYREKKLLVLLISDYEQKLVAEQLPEADPVELIKIRMEDFGYEAAELARIYGDDLAISEVLHYQQALSLPMIRKLSELLRISVESLIKPYPLKI